MWWKKKKKERKEVKLDLLPAKFPEVNLELKPPVDMPECGTLPVLLDKEKGVFVSFWPISPDQLERVKEGGGIWLGVIASSHPPVFLTIEKPIEEKGEK